MAALVTLSFLGYARHVPFECRAPSTHALLLTSAATSDPAATPLPTGGMTPGLFLPPALATTLDVCGRFGAPIRGSGRIKRRRRNGEASRESEVSTSASWRPEEGDMWRTEDGAQDKLDGGPHERKIDGDGKGNPAKVSQQS